MLFQKLLLITKNLNKLQCCAIHVTDKFLAGHSKWSNIRHIKALKDGQKSSLFAKFSRQMRLAIVEHGSPNPALNSALQNVIDQATKKNMPNSSIQSTLKKFSEQSIANFKRYTLEIKALNKIYIICILYTNNLAGTRMAISSLFKKVGASFTNVQFAFIHKGFIDVLANQTDIVKTIEEFEEICTEDAIECGAEDIDITDFEKKSLTFICDPVAIQMIKNKLYNKGYEIDSAEQLFIPNNIIELTAADSFLYETFKKKLKAIDGVEEIFDNVKQENDEQL